MIRTRHARARKRAPRKTRRPGEMNDVEKAYSLLLLARQQAGEIQSYRFEMVTFVFCHDPRTSYTPDFEVIERDGSITYHETKAAWKNKRTGEYEPGFKEDARTKLRTAAGLFPERRFIVAAQLPRKAGGDWMYEEISKP